MLYVHTPESKYVFFSQSPEQSQTPNSVREQLGTHSPLDGSGMGSTSVDESEKTKKGKPKPVLKVSKRGGVVSKNNRKKKANKFSKFSILGNNTAGLNAKKDSLLHNIKLFNYPSAITLQETKLRKPGRIKLNKLSDF